MSEIDFPSINTIETNVKIFEGDAPDNVDVESAFREGSYVGLFVNSSNPNSGPDWGLTSGGTLTAEAFVDVFEKTSDTNNGIMRLRNLNSLDGSAWNSLTSDGSLTGWSIRTSGENTDYFGRVFDSITTENQGSRSSFCLGAFKDEKARILIGPTSQGIYENIYLLFDCGENGFGFDPLGRTADIGETLIRSQFSGSDVFQIYTCIDPGVDGDPVTPAVFTGPSETPETYFTSYTPLTGGAQCDYPYQFNNNFDKVQEWSFDCSVSGWIGEGSTITGDINQLIYATITSSTQISNKAQWNYNLSKVVHLGNNGWAVSSFPSINYTNVRNILENNNNFSSAYGLNVQNGTTYSKYTGFNIKPIPDDTVVRLINRNGEYFFSAPNPIDGDCL